MKQKLKTVEQERDSLRTVIEMLKADNDQRSEWQVIEAKTKKTAPTKGKNFDTTTVQGEPVQNEPLQVSIQYAALDSNDVSCKTLNEAETRQNEEKSTVKALKHGTVVIGDSMLKGLRQHSISKATRSNVQIKCFPGARLRDMKHYSIPPLSTTKPKNVILHVGTNDLHNKKPSDIMKDARELCDQIQNTCPNSTITIS